MNPAWVVVIMNAAGVAVLLGISIGTLKAITKQVEKLVEQVDSHGTRLTKLESDIRWLESKVGRLESKED